MGERCTVAQMIEMLSVLQPDFPLFVAFPDGGYDDASFLELTDMVIGVNEEPWMGAHEQAGPDDVAVTGFVIRGRPQ